MEASFDFADLEAAQEDGFNANFTIVRPAPLELKQIMQDQTRRHWGLTVILFTIVPEFEYQGKLLMAMHQNYLEHCHYSATENDIRLTKMVLSTLYILGQLGKKNGYYLPRGAENAYISYLMDGHNKRLWSLKSPTLMNADLPFRLTSDAKQNLSNRMQCFVDKYAEAMDEMDTNRTPMNLFHDIPALFEVFLEGFATNASVNVSQHIQDVPIDGKAEWNLLFSILATVNYTFDCLTRKYPDQTYLPIDKEGALMDRDSASDMINWQEDVQGYNSFKMPFLWMETQKDFTLTAKIVDDAPLVVKKVLSEQHEDYKQIFEAARKSIHAIETDPALQQIPVPLCRKILQ